MMPPSGLQMSLWRHDLDFLSCDLDQTDRLTSFTTLPYWLLVPICGKIGSFVCFQITCSQLTSFITDKQTGGRTAS